jgi:hypothetical protein
VTPRRDAQCVEGQIRAWQFPANGGRSTVFAIPFVFVDE